MPKKKIKLAHLYPKLLNIYGDGGNILTLKKRCEWRGIDIEIDEINIGDEISEHDIYFIGGGQDLQQIAVAEEMQKHKPYGWVKDASKMYNITIIIDDGIIVNTSIDGVLYSFKSAFSLKFVDSEPFGIKE
mgnify:CR=1 FL=1